MTPKRPTGAGAFPKAVATPAPTPPDPATLYAVLTEGEETKAA